MKMAASFCRKNFLNYKNCLFQLHKRTGYVVLIPESPKEVAECNVTSLENLPDFSRIDSDTAKQIVNKYAQHYDVGSWELNDHLQKMIKESKKVDVVKNVIEPLETLSVPFLSSLGVVNTLYFANSKHMPLAVYHAVSERSLTLRKDKFSMEPIFHACKKQLNENGENCTEEQKRILKRFIWEGVLNGFELDEKKRGSLRMVYSKIGNKRQEYEVKFKGCKRLFSQLITDPNFVKDSPEDFLRMTAVNLEKAEKGPWVIRLYDHIYSRFMEYCVSREARRHIWLTYNQICSPHADIRTNASTEITDIRNHRQILAEILGFPSYVHLAMKTKMAGSVENVQNMLNKLLEPAKYAHEKELYELEKFAYDYDFRGSIELWDLPYWMRMERKHKYGLDELVLKDYFPLGQVLLGLIALCEQLFGIEIEEQTDVEGWHPDVSYFRIRDQNTKAILGGFYFDPYARVGKAVPETDIGLFIPIRPRSKICASLPLSSLLFNFSPPKNDKPSLLYYREIEILFVKFGSMLQYTLTQTSYSEVSGQYNIELDAVNICGAFLKFWLSQKETVESISGHYDTGEPLPSHVVDSFCEVHKQMAGTKLCHDIYLSNLDLDIHLQDEGLMDIVDRLWPEHLLFVLQKLDFHPYGFKDIFINFWGSSYYSQIWSKMVAADAFAAFKEVGFNNHEEIASLGKRFRSTFFALGGGCEPGEVFRKFRGRDPDPMKLAELLNLKKPVPAPSPNIRPELAVA